MAQTELVKKAQSFAKDYLANKIPDVFVFHSAQHTEEVVDAAKDLAKGYPLSKEEMEDMLVALWFHDLGFSGGWEGHEERSASLAKDFYKDHDLSQERIDRIMRYIMATVPDKEPGDLAEEIIRDADTAHVGSKGYLNKLGLLKSEWEYNGHKKFSEKEWLKLNLEFLGKHEFQSSTAQTKYNDRKRKNILKLQKQLAGLLAFEKEAVPIDSDDDELVLLPKKSERGVETMFRVTLRNHNHLSRIADNKANIMLSINAIMMSIVISSLTPKLDANPRLIIPTIIIILVCMVSIILATLSTRPKITSANYSDEKFLGKRFNILFFGNFYQLPLDKFEWGISKLMRNEDLLYSSLSKDLYYLGLVLAKKYKYLHLCYNIFMVGLFIAAIAFIYAFATAPIQ